jgi:hypothetical protein
LRIQEIIWLDKFVEKIERKHSVTTFEVQQILRGKKKVRRMAKGDVAGESVLPISARDMDDKERRRYERKG